VGAGFAGTTSKFRIQFIDLVRLLLRCGEPLLRPAYGIDSVSVPGQSVPVVEEVALTLPFGTLLHFRKPGIAGQPPVLLAAPLSGHFATLLRETARTLLQDLSGLHPALGLLSMNLDRHKKSFADLYRHLVEGDLEKANVIRVFYEEYLAVNDLPAEFYLETVEKVFQTYELPLGKLHYRGRKVDPAAIRRTALCTVEGERDDICSVGQTVAAQDLCSSIRPYRKTHHIQTGVGHYGVFSGRRWVSQIYPRVRDVIHSASA
jgi:poly-beta-hydroxyalkanoate depolymerase